MPRAGRASPCICGGNASYKKPDAVGLLAALSVRSPLSSSAQAETGEAETEQRERPRLGDFLIFSS